MILVFGQTGQVASALRAQAGSYPVRTLPRATADLRDPEACVAQIRALKPRAVINAAAYTAVDRAETEEALALTINAHSPGAMARCCAEASIPLCHISTDYVFDGTAKTPYCPDSKPNPLNAYGRTKLAGEEAVRAAGGPHVILRTSWVFSRHGGNFVKTMLRLSESRDALDVVEDQIGGPTPARSIAATLLEMTDALLQGHGGGTYHCAGAPYTSWRDFAREIFAQAGRRVTVTGIPTAAYPTPAARPLNGRLDCRSLARDFAIEPPSWQAELGALLKDLT